MDDELREKLRVGWEYTHLHDSWVEPLTLALEGIRADQASLPPAASSESIWRIVLHLAVWNENIVARIRQNAKLHPEEGAWPELPSDLSEESWTAAKLRLADSIELVDQMLKETPIEELMNNGYGLADILCRFTHMGYHIGQIVKIREILGY